MWHDKSFISGKFFCIHICSIPERTLTPSQQSAFWWTREPGGCDILEGYQMQSAVWISWNVFVSFLPFSLQSHRSVWSYRLLMFVCCPACSLSLLCQSASGGLSCAWKCINHPTIVHHQNDVRCYANIALQAIYISIVMFGGVLPCPFAVPHISIIRYTMKFSWPALVGRESREVIFTRYCYRISKGDSWPSSCKQKQD